MSITHRWAVCGHGRASLLLASALIVASTAGASGKPLTTVLSEGVAERPTAHHVLHNARIVVEPGKVIERGSIEIRDGRIVAVNSGDLLPAGAAPRDLHGKTVFAGFIDIASELGVPKAMRAGGIAAGGSGQPAHDQQSGEPGARHWNRRVRPEWSVAERLEIVADDAKATRALGFTTALAAPAAGIFRGQSALLSLIDSPRKNASVLRADVAQHVGFDFAYGSEYPGSLMGAIALVRQTLHDARWQAEVLASRQPPRIEADLALAALAAAARGEQAVHFQLDDELDLARVARLRDEFGLRAIALGSGHEYRVLDSARRSALPMVLPLGFPEPPTVEDAETALALSLAELQHWEQAPANPARVEAAGLRFALTRRGLREPATQFWPNLRRAVAAGLSEDAALRALTLEPAALLGESTRIGRVASGQLANLVVADGQLFRSAEAKLYEVWVEGQRHVLAPVDPLAAAGEWTLVWADGVGPEVWTVSGSGDTLDVTAGDSTFKLKRDGERLIGLPPASLFAGESGLARIELRLSEAGMRGHRALADGRLVGVEATRLQAAADAAKEASKDADAPVIPDVGPYPAGEFARTLPAQPSLLLVRGATVWTNAAEGVIEGGDLLVRSGKIAAVGRGLQAPAGAVVIEAAGRHLTPGIIDAHSHTAIARNVNEPSHAVTTEVRIGDVIDPTDISIYRQLSGGVTAANLLHGSANPMGGQNAVIKLRWGADADGLLMAGAPAGVKFALGENVKQSNWGPDFTSRYPQTRMGVEQIMREHFNAARAYAAERARKGAGPLRRDLRLEALAEILAGQRLIHIHSYRQDELLMFVRLAQEYGLPVATFQHVLEGYKVATEIASIGAGASAFSDWWSFKMEAFDAIPHQAALMTAAGVVVSFNSDSDEMARRLPAEAAKAIKYGGMAPQEALKLVTLNPARQLRIDDRVGALRVGLDADFVLWSGPPLSSMSRVEQTWIDGRRMFDRTEDARLQVQAFDERERLLGKAAEARAKTLALTTPAPAKADAADTPAANPGADPALWSDRLGWLRFAADRGLYHSGEGLNSCEAQSHGH